MRHHATLKWEQQLDKAMQELDHVLEEQFAGKYSRHPARPKRGTTAHHSHDGLLGIYANFTMGIGSQKGKGYVVDIKLVTLENVPTKVRKSIEDTALSELETLLPKYFPSVDLDIAKDGPVIKIYGDLSLGTV